MKNNNRKINLYTQVQRFAARVLFIVWLLGSCSPQSILALGLVQALVGSLAVFGGRVSPFQPPSDSRGFCQEDEPSCLDTKNLRRLLNDTRYKIKSVDEKTEDKDWETFFRERNFEYFWEILQNKTSTTVLSWSGTAPAYQLDPFDFGLLDSNACNVQAREERCTKEIAAAHQEVVGALIIYLRKILLEANIESLKINNGCAQTIPELVAEGYTLEEVDVSNNDLRSIAAIAVSGSFNASCNPQLSNLSSQTILPLACLPSGKEGSIDITNTKIINQRTLLESLLESVPSCPSAALALENLRGFEQFAAPAEAPSIAP